jgi:Dimerisation domain
MIQELPPPMALFWMASGFYVSRALYVAAKLGIADLLAHGPRSHGELAEATGTHASSLRRVLRLLASVAVFSEEADGRFTLTPIGRVSPSRRAGFDARGSAIVWRHHRKGVGRSSL